MAIKLKPLSEQVIVIVGASSGIGLSTARMAARRGAKVVVVARSADALAQLQQEITAAGGTAMHVVADVSDPRAVELVSAAAVTRFGGFDTWVNDAAVSIYGRLHEVSLEDARRLFDVNFWGQVYGSLTAVRHLRGKGLRHGGALINIGSTVSERAMPLQGMYGASKHAIKGFTDALRMELEEEGAPISVSLVKPGSINTPFTEHAKNHMGKEADYPPPVYEPSVVAEAILHCAEHPTRDVFAGWGGKMNSSMGAWAPRLTDLFMKKAYFAGQQKNEPPKDRQGNLYAPAAGGAREHGSHEGHVRKSSVYTQASLRPWTSLAIAGAGIAVAGMVAKAARDAD